MSLRGSMLRIHALILFAAVLSGCASISDERYSQDLSQQWVGKTISEVTALVQRPPSRVMNLPDGTVFYVWSQDRSYASKGNYVSGLCEITAQAGGTGVVTSVFSSGCDHFKTGEYRWY